MKEPIEEFRRRIKPAFYEVTVSEKERGQYGTHFETINPPERQGDMFCFTTTENQHIWFMADCVIAIGWKAVYKNPEDA